VDTCRIHLLELEELENAIFASSSSFLLFLCLLVSPLGDSCVSVGSGLLRGDTMLQAKQADKALMALGVDLLAVLPLAAKCLLFHHEGICGFVCLECNSFLSLFFSFRSGQASRMKI